MILAMYLLLFLVMASVIVYTNFYRVVDTASSLSDIVFLILSISLRVRFQEFFIYCKEKSHIWTVYLS